MVGWANIYTYGVLCLKCCFFNRLGLRYAFPRMHCLNGVSDGPWVHSSEGRFVALHAPTLSIFGGLKPPNQLGPQTGTCYIDALDNTVLMKLPSHAHGASLVLYMTYALHLFGCA